MRFYHLITLDVDEKGWQETYNVESDKIRADVNTWLETAIHGQPEGLLKVVNERSARSTVLAHVMSAMDARDEGWKQRNWPGKPSLTDYAQAVIRRLQHHFIDNEGRYQP